MLGLAIGLALTVAIGAAVMGWALCSAAARADAQQQQWERERHAADDWRRVHSGGREY